MKYFIFSLCYLFLFFSCSEEIVDTDVPTQMDSSKFTDTIVDAHTLSNYKEVSIAHTHLDIEVDFNNKTVKGIASHTINNPSNKDQIILDTKNLEIYDVTLDDGDSATYFYGENDAILGLPLIIKIKEGTQKVNIHYSTTDGTEALDWLVPEQTADKSAPYMYTQGQSIFTRSWIPIQDTPGSRITYSAKVKVPEGMLAVMSASNPVERNPENVYEFNMPQPIPCYLIALAVGDLYFAPIDHRTGVYTEKSMLDACAYELGDMGKMVDAAETLYGDYQWERYDVIVLPPSFPFGGMENPRLTFATPTMIAGDRSLTALIAHELAHSWSGNLVTNATWDDFWLNEGFTVYFERRIMEDLYGKDYVEMLALLGYQDLQQDVSSLDPKYQLLKLKLKGGHPDDGMNNIAYEKGYFFLRYVEESVGRAQFDEFLKAYFDNHKFQTIVTEYFVEYLQRNLLSKTELDLNIREWVYQPGIPDNCPKVVSSRFNNVESSLKSFYVSSDINEINAEDWSTHEWRHFVRNLNPKTTPAQMRIIDEKFNLTNSGNSEILAAWFEQSIKFGYDEIYPALEKFLVRVGRRKFLEPLYKALANSDEGMQRAREIYAKARGNYHYISFETIDKVLELKN
jgi:leukotriene A-4 hydrolase/aminopeptidase